MTEQFKIGPDVIRTTAPPYFKNNAVFDLCQMLFNQTKSHGEMHLFRGFYFSTIFCLRPGKTKRWFIIFAAI
jgi:hypothetical protein